MTTEFVPLTASFLAFLFINGCEKMIYLLKEEESNLLGLLFLGTAVHISIYYLYMY